MNEDILILEKLYIHIIVMMPSAVSFANQIMSRRERYFEFYEKFAIPYFFQNINIESYKSAFRISEYEAFKNINKVNIRGRKSEYRTSLQKQNQHYRLQLFRRLRGILFSYLPFKFAYYTYTRIVSIYFI